MAKKNMRNEFEFMASVLDALGVEYEEADIKVRERWRGKVLEGWGVEYIPDDLKQFERWRGKCIEGLSKGGGGSSDFTIKTIVKNVTTGQIITSPNLIVAAQPLLNAYIVDGDEPYTFVLEGEGDISFCYQDYETSSFIDTVTLKTKDPLSFKSFVVMLGEDKLKIEAGSFNGTAIDVINGFNIENDGTLILMVKMIH